MPCCLQEDVFDLGPTSLLCAPVPVGVQPKEIDFLVVNCSLFNPTPSLSALVVNQFKLRSDIVSYNLSGEALDPRLNSLMYSSPVSTQIDGVSMGFSNLCMAFFPACVAMGPSATIDTNAAWLKLPMYWMLLPCS